MPDSKGELKRYRERFEREFDPPDDWRVTVYWLDRYYVWLESALSTAEQRIDGLNTELSQVDEAINGYWNSEQSRADNIVRICSELVEAEQRIEELEKMDARWQQAAVDSEKELMSKDEAISKAEATIAELKETHQREDLQ